MSKLAVASRRAALGCLAALALGAFAGEAGAAKSKRKKLRAVRHGGPSGCRGTTFLFDLDHAPFARGTYDDATVLVYVPAHYRLPESGAVDIAVHFHGHRYPAERATLGHVLREQLDDSLRNAILVVPQLAVMTPDSCAGQLEDPGGLARLLAEVVRELRRPAIGDALGAASLRHAKRAGTVCASAHSGGYNAAAHCLEHGGTDVRECFLFDALYGKVEVFRDWLAGGRRKLWSFYAGGEVTKCSLALLDALKSRGIDCRHEQKPGELGRADLVDAQALFISIAEEHAGAPFAQNNFRDCLHASVFAAAGPSGWLDNPHPPRVIDRRGGG